MLSIGDAIIYLILVGDIFSILFPKPFHFDEHLRLIYLHSQKQDNLDDDLHEIRMHWRRLHMIVHTYS